MALCFEELRQLRSGAQGAAMRRGRVSGQATRLSLPNMPAQSDISVHADSCCTEWRGVVVTSLLFARPRTPHQAKLTILSLRFDLHLQFLFFCYKRTLENGCCWRRQDVQPTGFQRPPRRSRATVPPGFDRVRAVVPNPIVLHLPRRCLMTRASVVHISGGDA